MKTSFQPFSIVASVAGLLWGLALCPCPGEDKPTAALNVPLTVIPATAQVGKFQVGVTTMEQLEAAFGKGRPFTGGHPQGAREWCSRPKGWYIYADGFDYNNTGRVVENFKISTAQIKAGSVYDTDFKIRWVTVGKNELAFLGGIAIGMGRSKAMDLLVKKGIVPTRAGNVITWSEKGYVHIDRPNEITYTIWTGKLTFRDDKLVEISIN
jgi:hypothetical protein